MLGVQAGRTLIMREGARGHSWGLVRVIDGFSLSWLVRGKGYSHKGLMLGASWGQRQVHQSRLGG